MPGVIIHELAHFLTAELLFVKAHELEVAPHFRNGSLQMGSVKISETDIFRRMIIGVAPVLVGSFVMGIVLFYFVNNVRIEAVFSHFSEALTLIGILWVIFFITNTMFSSKKDVEGFFEFFLFLGFSAIVLYVFALIMKINFLDYFYRAVLDGRVVESVRQVVVLFVIPVAVNLAVMSIARIILGQAYRLR